MVQLKKGQLSLEYLYVIGFLLVVLTPLIYYSFDTSSSQIRMERFSDSISALKNSINTVYSLGPRNVQHVKIDLPSSINFINISGREINIQANINGLPSDFHFTTPINVTGSIDNEPGTHNLKIEYLATGSINISEPS